MLGIWLWHVLNYSNDWVSLLSVYFYKFGLLILNIAPGRYSIIYFTVFGLPSPIFLICIGACSLERHVNGFVQCELWFSEYACLYTKILSDNDKPVMD